MMWSFEKYFLKIVAYSHGTFANIKIIFSHYSRLVLTSLVFQSFFLPCVCVFALC